MKYIRLAFIVVIFIGCAFGQQKRLRRAELVVDKTYLPSTHDGGQQLSEAYIAKQTGTLYLTRGRGGPKCHPLSSGRTYEWEEPSRTWLDDEVLVYKDPDCGGLGVSVHAAQLPLSSHIQR